MMYMVQNNKVFLFASSTLRLHVHCADLLSAHCVSVYAWSRFTLSGPKQIAIKVFPVYHPAIMPVTGLKSVTTGASLDKGEINAGISKRCGGISLLSLSSSRYNAKFSKLFQKCFGNTMHIHSFHPFADDLVIANAQCEEYCC